MALLIIAATLIPGNTMSLVWPQEYLILIAWMLLGVFVYWLAPRDADANALAATLGSRRAVSPKNHTCEQQRRSPTLRQRALRVPVQGGDTT